ncbi:MAG: hypothetical protein QM496_13905 [Verrucomicrobiota bacterium]
MKLTIIMKQLHLAIGHRTSQKTDKPYVVYCGVDADQCKRASEAILEGGLFVLVDTYSPSAPVTRYADPKLIEKITKTEVKLARKKAKAAAKVAEEAAKEAEQAAKDAEQTEGVPAPGDESPASETAEGDDPAKDESPASETAEGDDPAKGESPAAAKKPPKKKAVKS